MSDPSKPNIEIRLNREVERPYRDHPIHMGIPFPRGLGHDLDSWSLIDPAGVSINRDLVSVLNWPDGSVKWAHLHFLANSIPGETGNYYLSQAHKSMGESTADTSNISVRKSSDQIVITTGPAKFTVDLKHFRPFAQVKLGDNALLSDDAPLAPHLLVDQDDRQYSFKIDDSNIGNHGKVHLRLDLTGRMVDADGKNLCNAIARLFFYASSANVKLEFTLWNPKAAEHPRGIWDLGDPGSINFKSLEIPLELKKDSIQEIAYKLTPDDTEFTVTDPCELIIHQNSSGKPNWQSLAHVDKHNKPTPKFRGFKAKIGDNELSGEQANPALFARSEFARVGIAIEDFWQSFPNSIEYHTGRLTTCPFPGVDSQIFELQGGEKAQSTIWFAFENNDAPHKTELLQATAPIVPAFTPEWYCNSGCFPNLIPESNDDEPFFKEMTDQALTGDNSFEKRIEKYEEYGWRNFGEFPGDHEQLHYKGNRELVSHYNNQYDFILVLFQYFIRSGKPEWFRLARNMALHAMHIDLYNTKEDKPAYNGGPFWHTAHYLHAGMATHRTYSRLAADGDTLPSNFGGGPANETSQSSGFLLYYLLTTDYSGSEAVQQLYQWTKNLQDRTKTIFRFLSSNPTGNATCTRQLTLQSMGRGGAFSINTCLDSYLLTQDESHLALAEEYIRTCCHPGENPEKLDLLNREERWSYTVFLGVLGKYLNLKYELGKMDAMFYYAKAVLIRTVDWMVENEFSYLDRPSDLEFPTSTWAAQDLRKTVAFLLAAKYGDEDRSKAYLGKATEFLENSKKQIQTFDDPDAVRCMVLIMNCLPFYNGFMKRAENLPIPKKEVVFPERISFVPQKIHAIKRAKLLAVTGAVICALVPILYLIFS